jgi:hypothetical protein
MLGVSALLLAVSALANGRELARHLLDGPSQLGKLAGNRRYVLFGCHTRVRHVYADPTLPQHRGEAAMLTVTAWSPSPDYSSTNGTGAHAPWLE